jgi:hypothetical protein
MFSYLKIGYIEKNKIARWQFSLYNEVANSVTTRFLVWAILANKILIEFIVKRE